MAAESKIALVQLVAIADDDLCEVQSDACIAKHARGSRSEIQRRLILSVRKALFSCVGTAFAAMLTLIVGLGQIGAGHGEPTIWYAGLVIACAAWLLLLFSCAFGVWAHRRSPNRWPPIWLVLDWMNLIAATGVAVWGFQG
jgi:hypothetical protein